MTSVRCGVCDRDLKGKAVRRMDQTVLCATCYDKPVTIRTAFEEFLGARTFYVSSLSDALSLREALKADSGYVVKRFRQAMTCNCPDYTHRGQVLAVPCKHIRLVRLLAEAAGGYRRVPRGLNLSFRLSDKRKAVARVR